MAATAHAEQHPVRSGEAHGGLDIAVCQAARDQRRTTVNRAVPDLASFVVGVVSGAEHAAADLGRECVNVWLAHLPDFPVQREVSE